MYKIDSSLREKPEKLEIVLYFWLVLDTWLRLDPI